jgi:hypothetical protein
MNEVLLSQVGQAVKLSFGEKTRAWFIPEEKLLYLEPVQMDPLELMQLKAICSAQLQSTLPGTAFELLIRAPGLCVLPAVCHRARQEGILLDLPDDAFYN